MNNRKHTIAFILCAALGCGVLLTQTACPPNGPIGPVIGALVDCLGSNRPEIDKLVNEFRPLLGGGTVSWSDVKLRATQAGKDIGGCFIMELAQIYLSGTKAPGDAKEARDAAEAFRKDVAGGATFKTMCVREDGTKQECKL